MAFQVCVNNYHKCLQEEKWKFSSNSSHARNTFALSAMVQKLYQPQPNYRILWHYKQRLGIFLHEVQLKIYILKHKRTLAVYGWGFIKILSKYKFYIFHIIFAGFALSLCFSVLAVLQQYWKRRKPKLISLQLIKKTFQLSGWAKNILLGWGIILR